MLPRRISTLLTRRPCRRDGLPPDFEFFPSFFSTPEQRILLGTALQKLDASESRQSRRRRREFLQSRAHDPLSSKQDDMQSLFLPDEYYDFQEGHYDGVIRRYREMHVSSWPSDVDGLALAIDRLRGIFPSPDVQTHLLHLASDGEILPHIDNVGASGPWILGVSLGAQRLLKLERTENSDESYVIALPPGSVYVQRDSTRYEFKHSVLLDGELDGKRYSGGQRMSIMVRDRLSNVSQ